MIVTCPDCATRYRVDDAAFSDGGRAVRCNHCNCEWYQIGPSPAQAAAGESDALELSTVQIETRKGGRDSRPAPMGLDESETVEHRARPEPKRPEPSTSVSFAAASFPDESVSASPGDSGRISFEGSEPAGSTPERREAEKRFAERVEPLVGREKGDGFAHSVPVVVESEAPRAMGVRSGSGGQSRRGAVRGALFAAAALAVLAPVGFYYYGPSLKTAAPVAAPAVDTYRDQVDAVFANAVPPGAVTVSEGVVFVDYKYDLVERAEGPALEVWGRVANNGPQVELTPTIEIVSRDENGEALQRWLARPEIDQLQPGESARFASRMMYPMTPVFDVDLYIAAQ